MNCEICGLISDADVWNLDGSHESKRCRDALKAQLNEARAQLSIINTPEIARFLEAVEREAKHQRLRWTAEHDDGKADSDWFWLIGWLAGKAVHATSDEKRLHHIVTTAAACLNWHSQRIGASSAMRPGIASPDDADPSSDAPGTPVITVHFGHVGIDEETMCGSPDRVRIVSMNWDEVNCATCSARRRPT